MFKKLRDFYRRNRVYSILMIVSIMCIIAIVVGVLMYFLNQTNQDKYGNRLNGIENVVVSKDNISRIKNKISENEKVKDVQVELKGKLIYITINLSAGTHSDAEAIAQSSLESFGDEIKKFYDLQFIVTNEDKEIEENFPIMGYLKSGNAVIRWTNYIVGE